MFLWGNTGLGLPGIPVSCNGFKCSSCSWPHWNQPLHRAVGTLFIVPSVPLFSLKGIPVVSSILSPLLPLQLINVKINSVFLLRMLVAPSGLALIDPHYNCKAI